MYYNESGKMCAKLYAKYMKLICYLQNCCVGLSFKPDIDYLTTAGAGLVYVKR